MAVVLGPKASFVRETWGEMGRKDVWDFTGDLML